MPDLVTIMVPDLHMSQLETGIAILYDRKDLASIGAIVKLR